MHNKNNQVKIIYIIIAGEIIQIDKSKLINCYRCNKYIDK